MTRIEVDGEVQNAEKEERWTIGKGQDRMVETNKARGIDDLLPGSDTDSQENRYGDFSGTRHRRKVQGTIYSLPRRYPQGVLPHRRGATAGV